MILTCHVLFTTIYHSLLLIGEKKYKNKESNFRVTFETPILNWFFIHSTLKVTKASTTLKVLIQ